MVRAGMGVRTCDVAACLNVSSDHLGLGGVDTLDQLAEIKRIPIEVATDTVVLNADDPRVLAMAAHTDAAHICYVTMDAEHALVRAHVQEGGRAVVLERGIAGEMITLFDGGRHLPLLRTHLIPATIDGKATHNVQNAMFAAGIAYALGEGSLDLTLDQIRHGLQTFTTSFYEAPGRLNVFDGHPFRVILDYAHNPAAVAVMADLVDRLDVPGRRILAIAAPGDRRDEDVAAMAPRRRRPLRPLRLQARRPPARARAQRGPRAAARRPAGGRRGCERRRDGAGRDGGRRARAVAGRARRPGGGLWRPDHALLGADRRLWRAGRRRPGGRRAGGVGRPRRGRGGHARGCERRVRTPCARGARAVPAARGPARRPASAAASAWRRPTRRRTEMVRGTGYEVPGRPSHPMYPVPRTPYRDF